AVIRQLWTYDPPLSESDIQSRIDDFDAAVADIERDIERSFAETRPAPRGRSGKPRPPAGSRSSVYEGYDEASDYASSIPARPPARGSERDRDGNRGRREPPPAAPDIDEASLEEIEAALSARSSAIERSMRQVADDPEYDADDDRRGGEASAETYSGYEEDLPPYEADTQTGEEEPYPFHDRDDHAGGNAGEDEDVEPGAGPVRRGFASAAHSARSFRPPKWSEMSESARIKLLLGAIGVLLLLLVGLAAILLTRGSVPRQTVADPAPSARSPVAIAANPGANLPPPPAPAPSDALETFVIFDGRDPTVFQAASGNPVRFEGDTTGGFARVSSSAADAGVRVLIGPGLAGRLAGRNVRLTITARSASENGALGMRFAYQSGVALSPWQSSNLSPDFAAINLTWRVPTQRTDPNGDYILIEPGIPGDGTGVDVKSIRIDVLS